MEDDVPGAASGPWPSRRDTCGHTEDSREITMDLRFVVFNRIVRDELLRRLLVSYADRVEAGASRCTGGDAYLALKWVGRDGPSAPAGAELLLAQVHVPGTAPAATRYLDQVLQRFRAAVTGDGGDDTVVTRCLGSSLEATASSADTLVRTTTFLVAPAPLRHAGPVDLGLAPWRCPVDAVTGGSVAAGGGGRSMN
jgi:hypothetical protein